MVDTRYYFAISWKCIYSSAYAIPLAAEEGSKSTVDDLTEEEAEDVGFLNIFIPTNKLFIWSLLEKKSDVQGKIANTNYSYDHHHTYAKIWKIT